ncbi:MAG: hypothetical protein GX868_01070 [Actinobacteria bacterium]|nr:hypothetical protein [Actinomycetota bacterium]
MPLDVSTKDCSQLSEEELAEMTELCADVAGRFDLDTIAGQKKAWVLVTQVREGDHLRGFSFSTLERIGGTPAIIIGMAHVRRNAKRDQVVKALMSDNYRRALMAFPDEDVLVGTRLASVDGYDAFKALTDINPRPAHKSSGEDRAWGRRLAKRFGCEAGYDDKSFVVTGGDCYPPVFDHESLKPEKQEPGFTEFFEGLKADNGDCLIAFGWILAEDLLKYNA